MKEEPNKEIVCRAKVEYAIPHFNYRGVVDSKGLGGSGKGGDGFLEGMMLGIIIGSAT